MLQKNINDPGHKNYCKT